MMMMMMEMMKMKKATKEAQSSGRKRARVQVYFLLPHHHRIVSEHSHALIAANKRKRGQGLTYSEMIQTALRALGGAATQPKISRYIQEHFSAPHLSSLGGMGPCFLILPSLLSRRRHSWTNNLA